MGQRIFAANRREVRSYRINVHLATAAAANQRAYVVDTASSPRAEDCPGTVNQTLRAFIQTSNFGER